MFSKFVVLKTREVILNFGTFLKTIKVSGQSDAVKKEEQNMKMKFLNPGSEVKILEKKLKI